MKKTMLLLFALVLSSAICAQDYHVVLWDNTTAPTSNGLSGDEIESKPGQWKNTQTAEMWIYKAGDNATGQALVFFPGGGYSSLSVGNGHKEAQWFARNGHHGRGGEIPPAQRPQRGSAQRCRRGAARDAFDGCGTEHRPRRKWGCRGLRAGVTSPGASGRFRT